MKWRLRSRNPPPSLVALGLTGIFCHALIAPGTTASAPGTAPKGAARAAHAGGASRDPEALTFNRDIAPIIFHNCATCHRPGEVAPFPLLTYQDVKQRAELIRAAVEKREMPPWKPVAGYGDFLGSRHLTEEQIGLIKRWVEEGAAEGRPSDLPPLPKFSDDWPLGPPDLVATMSKPFEVPAGGPDVYRCFELPLKLSEDKHFVAFDLRPSSRKVVHHALVMQAVAGAAQKLEATAGTGYPCFGAFGMLPTGPVGLWTPGAVPTPEPGGVARVLKKGSDLILQIHFHPDGQPEKEQVSVGIYFAKQAPRKVPVDVTLGNIGIDMAPGEKRYTVTDFYVLPIDAEAIGIIPHCHLLCKEVKATATLPDGTVKPLLWIKDWDFNWQQWYRYASPVKLPQGTRVDAEWTYDNSAENPRNPNRPPQRVTWGEQSTDEMAELKLEVIADKQSDMWQLLRGPLQVTQK